MIDQEALKIVAMFSTHAFNQDFRRGAFGLGLQHGRSAMSVIGADIDDAMATHFLVAHPDISLDVLQQMPDVDRAISVRQGACDEDASCHLGLAKKARL